MAVTLYTVTPFASLRTIEDTAANATSEDDVLTGIATVYKIVINNAANSAASFLKLYNNVAPTVGTTAPDGIIKVSAGDTRTIIIPKGWSFPTALSFACVTAGGTAGITGPASAVNVKILATAA